MVEICVCPSLQRFRASGLVVGTWGGDGGGAYATAAKPTTPRSARQTLRMIATGATREAATTGAAAGTSAFANEAAAGAAGTILLTAAAPIASAVPTCGAASGIATAPAAMASFGKDFFSGSGSGAAAGAYARTAVSTRNANKKNHDAIWTNVGDDSVAGGGTQRAAGAAGAVFAFFFCAKRLRLIAVLLIERAKGFLAHLLEPTAGPVDCVFMSDSEIWETGTRQTAGGICESCARMSSGSKRSARCGVEVVERSAVSTVRRRGVE